MSRFTDQPVRRLRAVRRLRNAAFVAADITLVLGVAAGVRWWWINRTPDRPTPTVTLPNPNGYDTLIKAGKALTRVNDVGYAVNIRTAANQHVYSLDEKCNLVLLNLEASVPAHEALKMPIQAPPLHSFDDRLPELPKFRAMARLFMLEGEVDEAMGERKKAADSYVDAIELGVKVAHGGALLHQLVGIACQAIGMRNLVPLADKLTPDEAQSVLSRLKAIDAERTPFAETIAGEKQWMEQGLLELFHKYSLSRTLVKLRSQSGFETPDGQKYTGPSLWERANYVFAAFTTSKDAVLRDYDRYMEEQIAQAKLPYDRSRPAPKEPDDVICRVLLPVFSQAHYKDFDVRAHMALLEGKLALKAQAGETGIYPKEAANLPVDPFAKNGTDRLRYTRLSDTEYRLYSVGPDGKDDGGKPIAHKDGSGKIRRYSTSEDNGDIVLGIDLY